MSLFFRRGLAVAAESVASASSSTSRSAFLKTLPCKRTYSDGRYNSSPIHYRERQERFDLAPTQRSLTPSQELRFQELRAEGQFPGDEEVAREEFQRQNDEWRTRVRGHKQVRQSPKAASQSTAADDSAASLSSDVTPVKMEDGPYTVPSAASLTGHRIYLPNIQIRLMRNHTPPGQPYDTSVATFRIPPSMTKNDLRSYLYAVYNLPVTFIRTDNYIAPVKRLGTAGQNRRIKGSKKNYKRAVVGLVEPFHYPDDIEELEAVIAAEPQSEDDQLRRQRAIVAKDKRAEWLNDQYMTDQTVAGRKRSMMKMAKGWRWRSKTHDNQGNTVREIMKKRDAEQQSLEQRLSSLSVADQPTPA